MFFLLLKIVISCAKSRKAVIFIQFQVWKMFKNEELVESCVSQVVQETLVAIIQA